MQLEIPGLPDLRVLPEIQALLVLPDLQVIPVLPDQLDQQDLLVLLEQMQQHYQESYY